MFYDSVDREIIENTKFLASSIFISNRSHRLELWNSNTKHSIDSKKFKQPLFSIDTIPNSNLILLSNSEKLISTYKARTTKVNGNIKLVNTPFSLDYPADMKQLEPIVNGIHINTNKNCWRYYLQEIPNMVDGLYQKKQIMAWL